MKAKRRIVTTPLSLFQIEPENDRQGRYTFGIDIYDLMPKYVWGTPQRCDKGFLRVITRELRLLNTRYEIQISPATLKEKGGQSRQYLPGRVEEVAEAALRFLAVHDQADLSRDGLNIENHISMCRAYFAGRQHCRDSEGMNTILHYFALT